MSGIKDYSATPASNTALFPENMAPSAVNDGMRQVQADIRSWYTDAEWANWGDTPSRASATTFKIATDVTSRYQPNRAIKVNDAATYYGVITASSYSAPDTTVTVNLDSGSLTSSFTAVSLAILSPSNASLPTAVGRKGADVASASTIDLSAAAGTFVDVTGTTTITAITSERAGVVRRVRFTGALTLTHNATSLILPGGVNITTAASDSAEFVSLGSGNWFCTRYTPAAFSPPLVASQAQMEAATSNAVFATPGRMQNHPGVAKAWVDFTGTGTVTINASHNVSSITDNGTGDYTINFTTAFSAASYSIVTGVRYDTSSGDNVMSYVGVKNAGTNINVGSVRVAAVNGTDVDRFFAACFGDQ